MTQEGGFKINHATLEFGALVHPKHGLNYQRQNLMTLYLLHQPYVMYLELVSYSAHFRPELSHCGRRRLRNAMDVNTGTKEGARRVLSCTRDCFPFYQHFEGPPTASLTVVH